jgi:hypothetical protein
MVPKRIRLLDVEALHESHIPSRDITSDESGRRTCPARVDTLIEGRCSFRLRPSLMVGGRAG